MVRRTRIIPKRCRLRMKTVMKKECREGIEVDVDEIHMASGMDPQQ